MEQFGQPILHRAHISPPSESSPLWCCLELTVLRAENLPRLKTLFGKKRRFYVTATDGVTTKQTSDVQSVARVVQWNERIAIFDVHPSSLINISLYAATMIGSDILVGTRKIPCESKTSISFALEGSEGSGTPKHPVMVYLTVTVSTGLSSSNTKSTGKESLPAVTSTTPTTQPVSSEPVSPPVGGESLGQSFSSSQEAGIEAQTELSLQKVLLNAEETLNSIDISDTWRNAVENIRWVMDILAPVAELHPFAKMAWGLLVKIPQPFLQQFQRDDNVRSLLEAIRDGFDFAQEVDVLKNIKPNSKQAHILALMLQHVCNCGDFIQTYAKDAKFRKRFVQNISGKADAKISNYRTALDKLRRDFLDRAAVTTEINTFQILDDVEMISVKVKDISVGLERVSSKVSDMDLDTKIHDIPYKPGQRPGVERDYLPGTRSKFLDHIVNWVNNPNAGRGLILFGQAGTGKSSIAHEIARRFREMSRLSSYFIFLRNEQSKRKDYLLFTTLVRDLSNRYPTYKTAVAKAIGKDQVLPEAQDYHTLFEDLVLRPLQDLHIVGPILVVIDALDESGDTYGENGLHTFLAKNISRLPSQFRILITSRREKDIDFAFTAASSVQIIEMTDPVLGATTDQDIRDYLRTNLPQKEFEKHGHNLEAKAEGLFQWAAVACGYIRRPPPGFTINQCIKSLLEPSADDGELEVLDKLYQDILEGYFKSPKVRPLFRSVVGQLLAAFEPLSITSLTFLRQHASYGERDDEDSVTAIVSHLGSLLSNVTSPDSTLPIVPLHTSFRDFLTNEKKSGDFYVNLKTAHYDLADYCLGLMLDKLEFNICKLESSYSANKDIPDIDERINRYIYKALSYSCQFWDVHLAHVDFNSNLVHQLQDFFNNKFLFWLEVLSLTGNVPLALSALLALEGWLVIDQQVPKRTLDEFIAFINDATTFVRYFGMPIARSAPHIYLSCLPFTPTSSYVFRCYSVKFPRTMFLQRGQLSHWPAMEMVIAAHEAAVTSVSFSPDGQYIISGSDDGTICLWNARTGEIVGKPFSGHDGAVNSVAFSSDGQYIISGSDDGTVRVWNATMGEMVGKPFTGHDDIIWSVSSSPDGQYLVSGSRDRTVRVWNAMAGEMVGTPYTGHTGPVNSVSFLSDGQHILSGSDDGTVCVWNATTREMVGKPFTGQNGPVLSASFSPTRQHIVSSGSPDGTICVWNATTGETVGKPLTGHNDVVGSVAFSPDGQRIVSGSVDGTICVWNTMTGERVGRPFTGHNGSVLSISFSPTGQHVVSGSYDRTVRVWNTTTGWMAEKPLTGHNGSVKSASFSPDGQYIISGSLDGTIRLWNVKTRGIIGKPFTGHDDIVRSVSFSHDGQYIISGSRDRTIRMWDTTTGEMVGQPFTGHTGSINSVEFSPDGQRVVSGSKDCTIRVWNTTTGEIVGTPFTGHDDVVWSVSFSPDGRRIVSGSFDATIRVWDVTTGELVGMPLTGHDDIVWSVSFSPDGQYVVSGSHDRTIRVWNAMTSEMVGEPFTGHTGSVNCVSFSPDGQYVVSGSDDRTIRVWNTTSARMVGKPFSGHNGSIWSASFSPDAQHIVSGSDDRTLRLWDVTIEHIVGQPFTSNDIPISSFLFKSLDRQPADSDSHDRTTSLPNNSMENFHITQHSIINSDGWICGNGGELFLWIPQLHRSSLHRPGSTILGGHETQLDLSKLLHGRNWKNCMDNDND